MTATPGRFTVAVSALLEHGESGDVLLVRRGRDVDFAPGVWEDISGRVTHGEGLEAALRREIREETGIQDVQVIGLLRTWHTFRGPPEPEFELIGVAHWCRTNEREVLLSKEHDAYRWMRPEEAVAIAGTPGIRESILALMSRRDMAKRRLFVVSGLPGTGKTTVAEELGLMTGAVVLSLAWVLGAAGSFGIGDRTKRRDLGYRLLTQLAEHQLRLGRSVVLDSMAGSASVRDEWRRLADSHGAPLIALECLCSDVELHRRRVESRHEQIPGWPDPDWAHVEEARSRDEPWSTDRLLVDSARPLDENLGAIKTHIDAMTARV